jgi:3-oxoacyl-[acyl-carrier protein] reductase
VAIVSGASRGIGLATATELVRRGYRVAVTGRDAEALAAAVDTLGGPEHAIGVPGRAHHAEHREELTARTLATWGRLDALVNNVGTNPVLSPLAELDLDAARKILEINVLSALGLTQAALRAGLGNREGAAVVNVASIAGLAPSPGLGCYGISKAAMINMTQQLAYELAPRVRVNAVAPAVVKTRFSASLFGSSEEEEKAAAAAYPLGRLGLPDDVASAVGFLVSTESAWITGQTLLLDGGTSLKAGL